MRKTDQCYRPYHRLEFLKGSMYLQNQNRLRLLVPDKAPVHLDLVFGIIASRLRSLRGGFIITVSTTPERPKRAKCTQLGSNWDHYLAGVKKSGVGRERGQDEKKYVRLRKSDI